MGQETFGFNTGMDTILKMKYCQTNKFKDYLIYFDLKLKYILKEEIIF